MKIEEIERIIKIKKPLLFIDKVVELEKGNKTTCIKLFTYNENFFQGHFEGNPIVPGTILIECMLQSLKLAYFSQYDFDEEVFLLFYIPIVTFKKRVIPGDELKSEVMITLLKNELMGEVRSFVEGINVCSLTIKLNKKWKI